MNVIEPGSAVRIGNLEGAVASVCIYPGGRISYQCIWWDGATRKLEWLEAFEVLPSDEARSIEVGFQR